MRVGIVGAGLRGRMFAAVIDRLDVAEVVAFADPYLTETPRIGERAVAMHPSVETLFDVEELDAVIISTPDPLHAAPAIAAAERGVPMMLEKPVATTPADTLAIAAAVRDSGTTCMVAFENRWNAPFVKIHDLVARGLTGAPVFQTANLSNSFFVATSMLRWAAQSSPLWFLMPHTVDLVTWLGGSPIRRVAAIGTRGRLAARGVDTWDVVHVIAELDNGSTATLTSSWVLPDGSPSIVDFTYELVGENSSVRTDIGRSGIQHFSDRHDVIGVLDATLNGENTSAPAWMARDFIDCVSSGRAVPTNLEDALVVNDVLFAIERSLASGNPEDVTPIG